MSHNFDHIARRLWYMDQEAARLVACLNEHDRKCVEQRLLSLYGVSVHLTCHESDITTAVEKLRRV